jgi:N-acyl-D-amino-acid deacylase
MKADLNVIDPAVVGPAVPTVVNDLPGGGKRLEQRSHGILATVVGGSVTVDNGNRTEATPGRLVRGRTAGTWVGRA